MSLRHAAAPGLLAAALAAAGCGSDSSAVTGTVVAAPPSTSTTGPASDGLDAIVARCGLARDRSVTPELVPAEFKPSHTRVVAVARAKDGFTAALIFDRSVTGAFRALRTSLTRAGYAVTRSENEGRDAELFLAKGSVPAVVRLSAARACGGASQASVAVGGAASADD